SAAAGGDEACIRAAEAAQPLRASGHLRAAREKLLACSQPGCPSLVRADCTTWLSSLEEALPTIVPLARDANGNDISGAVLRIDGAAVELVEGRPLTVDPGRHVVSFATHDGRTGEAAVVVGTGEKNRPVSVLIPDLASVSPQPSPEAGPASGPGAV